MPRWGRCGGRLGGSLGGRLDGRLGSRRGGSLGRRLGGSLDGRLGSRRGGSPCGRTLRRSTTGQLTVLGRSVTPRPGRRGFEPPERVEPVELGRSETARSQLFASGFAACNLGEAPRQRRRLRPGGPPGRGEDLVGRLGDRPRARPQAAHGVTHVGSGPTLYRGGLGPTQRGRRVERLRDELAAVPGDDVQRPVDDARAAQLRHLGRGLTVLRGTELLDQRVAGGDELLRWQGVEALQGLGVNRHGNDDARSP
jgi:hypothetical protein